MTTELIVTRDRDPYVPCLSVVLDGKRFILSVADAEDLVCQIEQELKDRYYTTHPEEAR